MSTENFLVINEARLAEAEQRYAKHPTRKLEKELDWLRLLVAKARAKTITARCWETELLLREKWAKPEPDDSPWLW